MRSLLFIPVLLVGLAACERQARPVPLTTEADVENLPDQESWDAHFFVSEEGRPRLEIRAAHLEQYEREDSTFMRLTGGDEAPAAPVVVHVFDERGDSTATLTADRVYYFDTEQRFEAEGNVVVVTGTGRRLESEHLTWLEAEKTIHVPGFVRLVTPRERLQGYNLDADETLENFVLRRVTGRGRVEEE